MFLCNFLIILRFIWQYLKIFRILELFEASFRKFSAEATTQNYTIPYNFNSSPQEFYRVLWLTSTLNI